MSRKMFSTFEFKKLTGYADSRTIRALEQRGVIQPSRTDTGWRLFSEADVQRARTHRAGQAAKTHRSGG